MKPTIMAAVATTLAASAVVAGCAGDKSKNKATEKAATPTTCSAATLKGAYNYRIHGLIKQSKSYVPYTEVGREIYDGDGKVVTVSTNSLRRTTGHRAGTYSIRADCRGRASYAASKYDHDLYAEPSGRKLSLLLTDDAGALGALGGTETRASTQTQTESQLTCSKQTLKGTFAYHARGQKNRRIYVESGFETYDGQGNFTNTYNDSHSRTTTRTTGTYDVAADCTATATYANGDTYRLYVAPDGSTFYWLQTKGLEDGEFFSGLEDRISASPPSACSAATLKGTYAYIIHGLKKQGEYFVPYTEVGHKIYDGDGNVATVSTNSLRRTTGREAGTYSIRADCRGQASYAAGANDHQLYVDPSGQDVSSLLADGGPQVALGGTQTRASTRARSQLKCSTQTLKGTFAYHARGQSRQIYVESGFETYDGQGNFTNTYTDSRSRKTLHTTGTYDIAADCTGEARYAGGDTYHLYAAPDGSTFYWLQTRGLRAGELFGGLEDRISATPNYALSAKPAGTKPAAASADSVTTGTGLLFASLGGGSSQIVEASGKSADLMARIPGSKADNTAACQFANCGPAITGAANDDP